MTTDRDHPHDPLIGLLAESGLSSPSQRQQRLSTALRGLHQVILGECAGSGRIPARTELAPIAAALGLAVEDALADLVTSDLLVLTEAGDIAAAYPFSATPTSHRVDLAGGPAVSAMCAIDALGIPAMTGRDAVITSVDPTTGDQIHITVSAGHPHARPDDTVIGLAATGQAGPAARSCCPLINFHTSAQTARQFQDQGRLPGTVVSLAEATEAAARLFGPLLRPAS
jgi:hypothetical protein